MAALDVRDTPDNSRESPLPMKPLADFELGLASPAADGCETS